MATDQERRDCTTIVGGRPMRRAVEASDLPQGVERVLALAALNHRFREDMLRDPVAAAESKGIVLGELERTLLQATQPSQLASMAERVVIPRSLDRRGFVKTVSASIVAMVSGKALMLCSGCTGMDTWNRDASIVPGSDSGKPSADQRWMDLNGYTTYLYLPRVVADYPTQSHAVMLALHGGDETCLASVQRWRTAAETYGFALIAVSWTEVAEAPSTKTQLARDLAGILEAFSKQWNTSAQPRLLTSRGASTPIAFQAACVEASNAIWTGAAFLGGVPDGDWVNAPDGAVASMQSKVPRLYYLTGDADPEYLQASACVTAMRNHGMTVYSPQLSGSLQNAVLDFSAIYSFIAG